LTPLSRFLGAAGLFSVVAVALQGISQDSFAMPEMWINLGILAGMTAFALESINAENGDLSNRENQ
jgi:hypothetical protein